MKAILRAAGWGAPKSGAHVPGATVAAFSRVNLSTSAGRTRPVAAPAVAPPPLAPISRSFDLSPASPLAPGIIILPLRIFGRKHLSADDVYSEGDSTLLRLVQGVEFVDDLPIYTLTITHIDNAGVFQVLVNEATSHCSRILVAVHRTRDTPHVPC